MKNLGAQLAALAALSFASSCSCGAVANPEGARCDVGNVCPGGYVCIGGFCRGISGTGGGTATGGGVGGGPAGGTGGDAGGTAGGSPLCDGVVCNMPPAAMCTGNNVLRTFAGVCNANSGQCDYAPMDTQCPAECRDGKCTGATCTGVVCNTPPAPTCNGNNVRIPTLPGQCSNGACQYQETSMSCMTTCANGACVPAAAAFSQVLPRVRHAITAVDQEPNSGGDDVLAVGPAGQASRWNGTQWNPVMTGMNGNLSSVWFSAANTAYLVSETGLLKLTTMGVARVMGLPPMTGNSKLIDVHGVSDSNYAVVDNVGTVYRFNSNAWTTSAGNDGNNRDKPPYVMRGVYMEASLGSTWGARLRYWGTCGTPAGGCIVYQVPSSGTYYDDQDTATATIRSAGPSLEVTGTAYAGLDIPRVRRHDIAGTFDSTNVPTGLDGGAVVAITGSSSVTRSTFLLTAPDKVVGGLYRASGLATLPNTERLMDVLYGFQTMSKTESSGVIVVDMNTASNSSTITRRGAVVNEVLDLGAEDWVAGSAFANGSVLMNPYGDVAIRTNGSNTFQLRRYPFNLDANDIAAGTTFAVLTADDGTAWRLNYTGSAFTELAFTPKPLGFTGVCRASDSEWYLVGKGGLLFGYDGMMTRSMTSPTTTSLEDVDCPAPGAAVACGTGTVLRLQNGQWVAVPGAPMGAITQCQLVGGAIYVAGPNLYARYANGAWANLPARAVLDGLVVKSVNEAYAADARTLLRFDGTAWQTVTTAPQALLTGFLSGQRVVMAGSGGVVMEGQ